MAGVERPVAAFELSRAPGFALALNVVPLLGKNAADTIAIAATPAMTEGDRRLGSVRRARNDGARVPDCCGTAVGAELDPSACFEFVMVRIPV